MEELYNLYQKRIGLTLQELLESMRSIIDSSISNYMICVRVKSSSLLKRKMKLKNTENIFDIKDVYGVRIITATYHDVYKSLSLVKKKFSGYVKNDFVKESKTKRGKSVRFIQYVAYHNSIPFEIQITTKKFHVINEALHKQYSFEKYYNKYPPFS